MFVLVLDELSTIAAINASRRIAETKAAITFPTLDRFFSIKGFADTIRGSMTVDWLEVSGSGGGVSIEFTASIGCEPKHVSSSLLPSLSAERIDDSCDSNLEPLNGFVVEGTSITGSEVTTNQSWQVGHFRRFPAKVLLTKVDFPHEHWALSGPLRIDDSTSDEDVVGVDDGVCVEFPARLSGIASSVLNSNPLTLDSCTQGP